MKALSIRQPWAWLIIDAGKDIENRSWSTNQRGRILVHASKGMTVDEYDDAIDFALNDCGVSDELVPHFEALQRGGIVGMVTIVDCVRAHSSKWFEGEYGFVLRDPVPLPFRPYRGSLGFFDVPDEFITGGAPADAAQGKLL